MVKIIVGVALGVIIGGVIMLSLVRVDVKPTAAKPAATYDPSQPTAFECAAHNYEMAGC